MKLLFILCTVQYGGAEKHTEMLINQMVLRGHTCGIITNSPVLRNKLDKHVEIFMYNFPHMQITYYHFLKQVCVNNWDVIIPIKWEISKATCLLRKQLNRPLVCIEHSLYYDNIETDRPELSHILPIMAQYADEIVVVSQAVKQSLLYRNHSIAITVIPNVVDYIHNCSPYTQQRKGIVYIGRLSYEKGPDILIKAFLKNELLRNEAQLILVGDGPMRYILQKEASLSKSENIYFEGFRQNISSVLERARLVVIPSRREAFSLVALEARCAGVPVLAFNSGGLDEVVLDKKTGILLNTTDTINLSAAMEKMFFNFELCERMSRNALHLAHYRNFISTWATEFESVFQKALLRKN